MPRAGLSTARVAEEAAKVADAVGFDQLTLAAVAQRFGVALPSLYKHVSGLDALKREVAVLGLRELGAELSRATVGKAKGDALRGLASAYRAYARRCPGRYAATQRAPDRRDPELTAASDEVLQVVLAVLAGFGLKNQDAIDATRALRSALHGFVALETTGGFGLPRDVNRSFERMVDGVERMFAAWI